ncbi:MAG: RidA family protein [Proteobacteria bacterium]|nr:RidA family protein [Pseudomonadota bacterium]
MTITRYTTNDRMSQAVVHGDTVYLAGQVADDTSVGVAGQTAQILAKIDARLAEAGSDKSKLLTATLWITDMRYFNEMNKVWDAWLSPGNAPCRACVEANLAAPQYQVEIMVIAAL